MSSTPATLEACECSICYDVIDLKTTGEVKLSCAHSFHFSCIASWFSTQEKGSCPCCRKEMGDKEDFAANAPADGEEDDEDEDEDDEEDEDEDEDEEECIVFNRYYGAPIKARGYMRAGVPVGRHVLYFESGGVRESISYDDEGQLHGTCIYNDFVAGRDPLKPNTTRAYQILNFEHGVLHGRQTIDTLVVNMRKYAKAAKLDPSKPPYLPMSFIVTVAGEDDEPSKVDNGLRHDYELRALRDAIR
jgi:hypothetical protein